MKRILGILLSTLLALSIVQPAQAEDAFNADTFLKPEGGALFLVGESGTGSPFSQLVAQDGEGPDSTAWTCEKVDDTDCTSSQATQLAGFGVLPPCETATSENCVAGLELATADGDFESASLIRSIEGMKFPANKKFNFFAESTPSLWEAVNAPSASGTTTYAVIVRADQFADGKPFKFSTHRFIASVVPYREVTGNYKSPQQTSVDKDPVRGRRASVVGIDNHNYQCAWSEDGYCGIAQDFANGTRVKLSIRISNTVGGWFKGRMKNPSISVEEFSSTANTITVAAEPASVQRMAYALDDAKALTAKEKALVEHNGFAGSWDSFVTWAPAGDPKTFSYLETFRKKVKDTSVGVNTFWNFGSGDTGQGQCLSDTSSVLGIVTTNSMVYDGGVPKFSGGFLNYKVAGLHYMPDGETPVEGSYDLVMRSEVARCLYGFNKAPVSASITVTGEGDKSIATTVVGEKNGWLKLAAYGFTFSQKTLKVKLTQKKTTITCVSKTNKKKTKKVTGYSPKCPSGYKKK